MGIKKNSRANKLTIDSITLLISLGWMAWRQNNHTTPNRDKLTKKIVGMRSMPKGSRKGVPDILAINPNNGVLFGLEVKVDGDKMSSDQVEFKDDLQKARAKYFEINSIDDVINLLNDWREGKL